MLTTHADSFSMQPSHVADACCMENLMFYSGVIMLDEALWASPSLCAGVISGQCSNEPVAPVLCQQQIFSLDSFQFAILICASSIHLLCL